MLREEQTYSNHTNESTTNEWPVARITTIRSWTTPIIYSNLTFLFDFVSEPESMSIAKASIIRQKVPDVSFKVKENFLGKKLSLFVYYFSCSQSSFTSDTLFQLVKFCSSFVYILLLFCFYFVYFFVYILFIMLNSSWYKPYKLVIISAISFFLIFQYSKLQGNCMDSWVVEHLFMGTIAAGLISTLNLTVAYGEENR